MWTLSTPVIIIDVRPVITNNLRALGQCLVGVWRLHHFPVVPTTGSNPVEGSTKKIKKIKKWSLLNFHQSWPDFEKLFTLNGEQITPNKLTIMPLRKFYYTYFLCLVLKSWNKVFGFITSLCFRTIWQICRFL